MVIFGYATDVTRGTAWRKPVETEISMSDFFLPNGSKAHYKGEGNEFAELDIEVIQ